MSYRVECSPSLLDDVREQISHLRQEGASQETIDHWCGELFDVLDALRVLPKRHPVDPIQTAIIGCETRKLVFRQRYLVFYRVDDDEMRVSVDAFVHGARERRDDIS